MTRKNGSEREISRIIHRRFLLGFHTRKQERTVDYLSKKALQEKKKRVLEKIAVSYVE